MKKHNFRRALIATIAAISITAVFSVKPVHADTVNTDPQVQATNYQMKIHLNTRKNKLTEKVTIDVANNSQNTLHQLLVRNIAAGVLKYDNQHRSKKNKNLKTTVTSITDENNKKLNFKEADQQSSIYVNLPQDLKLGEKTKVTINVITDVPYRADRFGYQPVMGGKVYNLSFCFPYLSDYRNNHWLFHPYSDEGENRNSAVTNYHVSFYAPKSYTVAASGDHTTNKAGKTTIEAKQMRDLAIVCSNRFKVSHAQADGIKINNFYFASKNGAKYNQLAKQCAVDSFHLFNKQFGKYPYKQLDMTEAVFEPSAGGMEYPGLIMISDEGFLGKKPKYYELIQDVSHEIAHQWFFGTLGTDEYTEPWLDEGMAEYFEDFDYNNHDSKSIRMVRNELLKTSNKKVRKALKKTSIKTNIKLSKETLDKVAKYSMKKRHYINYAMNEFPKNSGGEGIVDYEMAPIFYNALRYYMGEKKFYAAMKDYCQTYQFKQPTGRDFLNMIKKYDDSAKVQKVIDNFIDPQYLR
ncbi:MAG: M1 family metallopeptidase [Lactobacillus kalixensis]|uniref:M1 family metallopeptidase n=1 Tax=Lactobacillus kalixensis TaxID=227944 RepID=UPI0039947CEE